MLAAQPRILFYYTHACGSYGVTCIFSYWKLLCYRQTLTPTPPPLPVPHNQLVNFYRPLNFWDDAPRLPRNCARLLLSPRLVLTELSSVEVPPSPSDSAGASTLLYMLLKPM